MMVPPLSSLNVHIFEVGLSVRTSGNFKRGQVAEVAMTGQGALHHLFFLGSNGHASSSFISQR